MPGGKTKFNPSWLEKQDASGKTLSLWCKKDPTSEFAGYCFVCLKSVSCSNSGAAQLINHADGQKHKNNIKQKLDITQKRFVVTPSKSTQGGGDKEKPATSTFKLQTVTTKDQVRSAEILWALKVATDGFSFRSCDNLPALFQSMFPGPVSQEFSMSRTKMSYIFSDGLGPYFRKEIAEKNKNHKVSIHNSI